MRPYLLPFLLLPVLLWRCTQPGMKANEPEGPATSPAPQTVMIKAHNGSFVGCELGGDTTLRDAVKAGTDTVGDWEHFTQITNADGTVAFQAANGQYWCADSDNGGYILANRGYIGAWESFEIVAQTGGEVAIRTHTGKYIAADHGLPGALSGRLIGDRLSVGDWELFTIIPVTDETP